MKLDTLQNVLDCNKATIAGKYYATSLTSNTPVSGDGGVLITSNKPILAVQHYYSYFNGVFAGRVWFRVGSEGGISGASGNWQSWIELHGVGKPYSANFIPDTTNSRNLGSSSVTWANVYTQNAVTVVSDRNAKKSIQAIDDKVLDAWSGVEQKQYKLNGDDNWSFGYIAQDIVDAFTRHGLDYKQYNIVHEENGKFMLKYDMCAVLDSALTRKRLKV